MRSDWASSAYEDSPTVSPYGHFSCPWTSYRTEWARQPGFHLADLRRIHWLASPSSSWISSCWWTTRCDQLCDAFHQLTRPTHQGQALDGYRPRLFQGPRSWKEYVSVAYWRLHSACARTSDALTSRNDRILAASSNWRIWVFCRW